MLEKLRKEHTPIMKAAVLMTKNPRSVHVQSGDKLSHKSCCTQDYII